MCTKVIFSSFLIIFCIGLVLPSVQSLSKEEFDSFKGKVDPASNCCPDALINLCNKVAAKLGVGPLKFWPDYPQCQNIDFQFDFCVKGVIHVVACGSSNYSSLGIGKGQSENGLYRYACFQGQCEARGDIADVFP